MKTNEYLYGNSYPGRLIVAGVTPSGRTLYAYAIMGRSTNSRNRVFEVVNGEVWTKAYDESLVQDPSLIIYPAILKCKGNIIVANGDQSLDMKNAEESGKSFREGLYNREFEPDSPNYTPRISAYVKSGIISFAINRRLPDGSCERKVWDYWKNPGELHIIHTYECDGNPLPSFVGAPRLLEAEDDYAQKLWDSLDKDNRISLYVMEGDKETVFNARLEENA